MTLSDTDIKWLVGMALTALCSADDALNMARQHRPDDFALTELYGVVDDAADRVSNLQERRGWDA